jgi:hypothetical protein
LANTKFLELVLVGEVENEIGDHKNNLEGQRALQEAGEDPDVRRSFPNGSNEAAV